MNTSIQLLRFPEEWKTKWKTRGCATIKDVLTLDEHDKVAHDFLITLSKYEFDYKIEVKADKSSIAIFSPKFSLSKRSIYEFCHLPCCGASMEAIKIGLDVITNGIVRGDDPTVLFIDPKAKLDQPRLVEYVDEFIDNSAVMIDVDAVLNQFRIENFEKFDFAHRSELCDEFLKLLLRLERGDICPFPELIIIDDIIYPMLTLEAASFIMKKTYFLLVSRIMRTIVKKHSTSIIYLRHAVTKVLGDGDYYFQPQYFGMWHGEFHGNMLFYRQNYELTSIIQTIFD